MTRAITLLPVATAPMAAEAGADRDPRAPWTDAILAIVYQIPRSAVRPWLPFRRVVLRHQCGHPTARSPGLQWVDSGHSARTITLRRMLTGGTLLC